MAFGARALVPLVALVAAAAVVARPAAAQGRRPDPRRALPEFLRTTEVRFGRGEYDVVLDLPGGRAVLGGDVEIEAGERFFLYARAVVLWGREVAAGSVRGLEAVYAEGDVLLSMDDQSFAADAIFLDVERGEGRLANATLRSGADRPGIRPRPGARRGGPLGLDGGLGLGSFFRPGGFAPGALLARARLARVADDFSVFEGEDVLVSTCTFGEPHFGIGADSARVLRRVPDLLGEEASEGDPDPGAPGGAAGARAELARPRLDIYGRTALLWPFGLEWDTEWSRYIPRVRVGETGRLGTYVLSEIPVYQTAGIDAVAKLDYMSERGGGYGANADWRGPPGDARTYAGTFDGYYIHDRGEDRDGEDPPDDRGRARLFHRDDLPYGLRREVEVSYISDRGFLPEYYEREAKTGKEQETAAYLRWLDGNMGATLLGRWRLNQFQTQVEYLPRARWHWIGEPILRDHMPGGWAPYLSTTYEISSARRLFDEDLDPLARAALHSDRVRRADFENRLDWPVPAGPVQIDPFALARYTAFSQRLDSEAAIDRTALGAGAIFTTDAWREFRVTSHLLAVTGIRHIVTPSIGYVRVFYDDVEPDELIPIDEVEQVRREEYIPLSIRNRIQGGRRLGYAGLGQASVDLADILVETRYFPRSSAAAPAGSFVDPTARRRWDAIRADVRLNPADFLLARWKAEWDPNGGGLIRQDGTATLFPASGVALRVSYRFREDEYDAVGLGVIVPLLTDKWGFRAETQYDLRDDDFIENELAVFRRFHRFVLTGLVSADFGEDDVRFSVSFEPVELFGRSDAFGGEVERTVDPIF